MGIESGDKRCECGQGMLQGMRGTRASREEMSQLIDSQVQAWPKDPNLWRKADRGAHHPEAGGGNGVLLRWQRVRMGVGSS
ncbi:MAG TPA: hypothetical protein DD670_11500 [Planctomycetaceae bacterium]|nr:hypothetical protein [Planctomycetaceae bacterium]